MHCQVQSTFITLKGDEFKLIYENKYVDGELVGIGKLIGACYINDNGANYSVLYNNKGDEGYFDAEGRPAKKAFLKAPVKFSRISSNYNLRRFHPIKGKPSLIWEQIMQLHMVRKSEV